LIFEFRDRLEACPTLLPLAQVTGEVEKSFERNEQEQSGHGRMPGFD
jgi:hypothetical protein